MKYLTTLILFIPFTVFSQIYFCNDDFCTVQKAKYSIYNQKLYKGYLFDETSILLNYNNRTFYKNNSQSSFDVLVEFNDDDNEVIKGRRTLFYIKENRIYFSEFNQYQYVYFTNDTIYFVSNNIETVLWSTFGNEELSIYEVISILLVTNF